MEKKSSFCKHCSIFEEILNLELKVSRDLKYLPGYKMPLHILLVSYKGQNNNHTVKMLHNVTTRASLMQDNQAVCAPEGQQEEHVT